MFDTLAMPWEVVLVDDESPDATWDAIRAELAQDPAHIVAIRLMRNFGQHNALMCGFARVGGDVIVTMDDDLQNPPEEIEKLLRCIEETDADVVYGRYDRKQHRSWRNAGSWLVNAFYRHAFKSQITVTSFRAIRKPVVDAILRYDLNFTFMEALVVTQGTNRAACAAYERVGYVPAIVKHVYHFWPIERLR